MRNEPDESVRKGRYLDIKIALLEIATILEKNDMPVDEKCLSEFMVFTNDLDASREESFGDVGKELKEIIVRSGHVWNSGHIHAAF